MTRTIKIILYLIIIIQSSLIISYSNLSDNVITLNVYTVYYHRLLDIKMALSMVTDYCRNSHKGMLFLRVSDLGNLMLEMIDHNYLFTVYIIHQISRHKRSKINRRMVILCDYIWYPLS